MMYLLFIIPVLVVVSFLLGLWVGRLDVDSMPCQCDVGRAIGPEDAKEFKMCKGKGEIHINST